MLINCLIVKVNIIHTSNEKHHTQEYSLNNNNFLIRSNKGQLVKGAFFYVAPFNTYEQYYGAHWPIINTIF